MSTVSVTNLKHASSASNNIVLDSSGNATFAGTAVPASSFLRNRIINGDMRIDQRNAGASVTPTSGQYLVDRFVAYLSQTSKFTAQQNAGSVTPPGGFKNYLGATSSSAYSVTSTDEFEICQAIEGFNVADLGWGAANAQTITLSFWVRSSLTGTFGGFLKNNAGNRGYVFSYSISAANTWEQKSVTISGDTTGTWASDNSIGILIGWSIGAGSSKVSTAGSWSSTIYVGVTGQVNLVGTNGATFYITGVQLEVGTAATPFERRQYGQELALCQRYFVNMNGTTNNYQPVAFGWCYTTTQGSWITYLPVSMRTTPTLSHSGTIYAQNLSINVSSFAGPFSQVGSIVEGDFTLASSTTSGNSVFLRWNNVASGSRSFSFSAEL